MSIIKIFLGNSVVPMITLFAIPAVLLLNACGSGGGGDPAPQTKTSPLPKSDLRDFVLVNTLEKPTIYVSDNTNNKIYAINAANEQDIVEIPGVGNGPADLDFNPVSKNLYVTLSSENRIKIIDCLSNKLLNEVIDLGDVTATSLAVSHDNKLYVGVSKDGRESFDVRIYDLDTDIPALVGSLSKPYEESDVHSKIVGLSHNRKILFTSEGENRKLDPFVTQWNIEFSPVAVHTDKLFGFDLKEDGKVVFTKDDQYAVFLSDGTASSQHQYKIYSVNKTLGLTLSAEFKLDYMPLAMSFSEFINSDSGNYRAVIAHDTVPSRWAFSEYKHFKGMHVHVVELGKDGALREIAVRASADYVSIDGIILRNSFAYLMEGKGDAKSIEFVTF